jgi:hypothetical protein
MPQRTSPALTAPMATALGGVRAATRASPPSAIHAQTHERGRCVGVSASDQASASSARSLTHSPRDDTSAAKTKPAPRSSSLSLRLHAACGGGGSTYALQQQRRG